MITKTDAIVLRVIPYRTTSHVVIWLSADGERITTVVKGAARPRSAFLGQYDLGYTCELLYYDRESNGIHHIRECSPLTTRPYLRDNWAAMACASYFCHLANLTVPIDTRSPAAYRLLRDSLDALAQAQTPELLLWFEMSLLHHLGLAPRVDACLGCGQNDPRHVDGIAFSAARGGILCPACRAHAESRQDDGLPIDPPTLQFLRHASTLPPPHTTLTLTLIQEFQTSRVLGMFLAYHVDLPPECRDAALRLLRFRTAQTGSVRRMAPGSAESHVSR